MLVFSGRKKVWLGDQLEFESLCSAVATVMVSFGVMQVIRSVKETRTC
jgi:hypothetical protein